jgi:hypothetical protein
MGKGSLFAEGTTVSPEKTRAEIETVLNRYGAEGFGYYTEARRARIQFKAKGRQIRFDLQLPDPSSKAFWQKPGNAWGRRTDAQAQAAWEAEVRRLWRALLLAIKAKLELVTSGISVFEEEFLAHIVMPDGRTVGEHALPAVARAYELGQAVALLPAGDDL